MLHFFLDFLRQFFANPAFIIALIALLGLILQRKPASEVIRGSVKTVLGFLVLNGGAALLSAALERFSQLFHLAFGVQGVLPNNEALLALASQEHARSSALILALAMFLNLFLARFSNLKYIFLTGHHSLYMACLLSIILAQADLMGWQLVLAGGCLLAFAMVFFPWLASPQLEAITGRRDLALGHFGCSLYVFSGWLGAHLGDRRRSTEVIKVPEKLNFLKDSHVSVSLTMFICFILVSLITNWKQGFAPQLFDGQNWLLFSALQAFQFAAGVYIVLEGVSLLLKEIVPAFKGISTRLVPHAKPALDCPLLFPYAENAVLLGFMASFAGGLLAFVAQIFMGRTLGLQLILPAVVPHFFCGAAAAIFGNARGGLRGAVIGAGIHGFLLTFLQAALLGELGLYAQSGSNFSDPDFTVVGLFLGQISHFLRGRPLLILSVLIYLSPILLRRFWHDRASFPLAE